MTWSTTHVAIGTILLYFLSTESFRKELRRDPKLFFTLSIATLLPDLDIFFGLHRSLFHSIFIPISFILIAPTITKLRKKDSIYQRNIIIFAIMWFSHTIFDLAFSGGIALFWPIDTRFYDFTMGVRLNLNPIFLSGLFIKVVHVDESIAIERFIVNQDVETRTENFGNFIDIPISEFPVHAAMFSVWFFLVLVPYLRYRRAVREEKRIKNIDNFMKLSILGKLWFIVRIPYSIFINILYLTIIALDKFLHTSRSIITTRPKQVIPVFLLALIVITSLYAGPYQGKEWKTQDIYSDQYVVLTDFFKFNDVTTFTVPPSAVLNVTLIGFNTTIDHSIFALKLDPELANETKFSLDKIIASFDDGNLTTQEVFDSYQSNISSFMQSYPEDSVKEINSTDFVSWSFITTEEITVFSGLYLWNTSEYFAKNLYTVATYTIDREESYNMGLIVALFSFILLVVVSVKNYLEYKKETSEEKINTKLNENI